MPNGGRQDPQKWLQNFLEANVVFVVVFICWSFHDSIFMSGTFKHACTHTHRERERGRAGERLLHLYIYRERERMWVLRQVGGNGGGVKSYYRLFSKPPSMLDASYYIYTYTVLT